MPTWIELHSLERLMVRCGGRNNPRAVELRSIWGVGHGEGWLGGKTGTRNIGKVLGRYAWLGTRDVGSGKRVGRCLDWLWTLI
jgi:hypothetical protein